MFYEACRWPVYPLFGGFPVRLTTYLGEPIYVTENDSDEKLLAGKIKSLLGHHISAHLETEKSSEKQASLKKADLEILEDSFIGHQMSRISSLEYICNSHENLRKRTNVKDHKLSENSEKNYQEIFNKLHNQRPNNFIENLYQVLIDHISFLKTCYQGLKERFKQITPLQEINFKKMQSYNLLPSSEKFVLLSRELAKVKEDKLDQIHLSYDHLQKTFQDQFLKTCSTLEKTYDEVTTEIKNTPMKLKEISECMRSRVRCLSSCSSSTENGVQRKDSLCSLISLNSSSEVIKSKSSY